LLRALQIHTIVCMFRANVYLGSIGDYLTSIGDADDGHIYQEFVAAIVPLGVVFVPIVSWLLNNKGYTTTCWVVFAAGLGYEGATIVESKVMQLIGALLFTFYRAALYSLVASFCSSIFGSKSVGRISGIVYTVTAGTILLQVRGTAAMPRAFVHVFASLCVCSSVCLCFA
jgi:hypothetical protein